MDAVKYIESLPEGKRAEVIDGKIYSMAPPATRHQDVSSNLMVALRNYIDSKEGHCKVYAAPFGVFLSEDSDTYLEPDICVICDTAKLDENGCHGAPELVIEILSPSTASRDMQEKLMKYKELGTFEYWIVDPKVCITTVHNFRDETSITYLRDSDIPVGIFGDCIISGEKLWKDIGSF